MQKCLTEKAFLVISVPRKHIADLFEYLLHFYSAAWTELQLLANFPNVLTQRSGGRKKRSHQAQARSCWGMWQTGPYTARRPLPWPSSQPCTDSPGGHTLREQGCTSFLPFLAQAMASANSQIEGPLSERQRTFLEINKQSYWGCSEQAEPPTLSD